jgi:3-hydroxyisobutyrate dehydrogenase-like beta-hydroxyacid dehydrogenase
MGSRLVKRLLNSGHRVTGYNRTVEKAQALRYMGLHVAATPREAAEAASIVFTMVSDNAALVAVTLGPKGVIAGLSPGAILVEMSTVSPDVTRQLGEVVEAKGAFMLDAPVSGSTVSVEQGVAIDPGGRRARRAGARPSLLLDHGAQRHHARRSARAGEGDEGRRRTSASPCRSWRSANRWRSPRSPGFRARSRSKR